MQYFSSQLLHSTPYKGEYRICRNKKGLAQISQLLLSASVPPNHFIHRETRFKLPFYSAFLALWTRSGATKPRLCVAIRPVDWLRDRAKKEKERKKRSQQGQCRDGRLPTGPAGIILLAVFQVVGLPIPASSTFSLSLLPLHLFFFFCPLADSLVLSSRNSCPFFFSRWYRDFGITRFASRWRQPVFYQEHEYRLILVDRCYDRREGLPVGNKKTIREIFMLYSNI